MNTLPNETIPNTAFASDETRWQALEKRLSDADGQFVYSVATTGVYCRPTCPSRLALRKNIVFYDTCGDAERAGYRPCKRCHPNEASQTAHLVEAVTRACRIIETADEAPSLDELASTVGLSVFHFHRVFKKTTGVTPRQYAAVHRSGRVKAELRAGAAVTNAIYDAGFSSSSRFYERSSETLGMTPREFQNGAPGVTVQYTVVPCSLGLVLIAGTARGICSVRFGDDRSMLEDELRSDFERASIAPAGPEFNAWVATVLAQIEHPNRTIDLPLDIRGTAFQQRVWQSLREIPMGETASYSDVAARIGQPTASRAVAGACAANPVAVVVPCHRVVRTNGDLSGYRWGVERKRKLLQQEGAR